MHCGLTKDLINTYAFPKDEVMVKYLVGKNIGYDTKNNKPYNWQKVKGVRLKQYYLACELSKNVGDICKVEELPYADMLTFSFPCQSISVAGKQEGIKKRETRSGLVYEIVRLVEKYKENNILPKYLLLENVKNLVGKKFINDFKNLCELFDSMGYNVYWKVINSKNCGVPQNRERVFGLFIRKDIDVKTFTFPIPFDNGIRLKDILENEVDEKYYLSQDKVDKILNSDFMQEKLRIQFGDTCSTLLARDYKDPKCVPVRIGNIYGEQFGTGYAGNVWSKEAICPTLTTAQGGNRQPMVVDKVVCEQRCDEGIRFFKDNTCGALRTIDACGDKRILEILKSHYRVRKLTPTECWGLMGFKKEHVNKCIEWGLSNSALYKQAGNSIVTNCIELIAEHLYKAQYNNNYICKDENFTQPQEV